LSYTEDVHAEVAEGLAACQRFIDLDAKLAALLKGKYAPHSSAERRELALLCYQRGFFVTSAQLFKGLVPSGAPSRDAPLTSDRPAAAPPGGGRDAIIPLFSIPVADGIVMERFVYGTSSLVADRQCAISAAAMAACGRGNDSPCLGEAERTQWRTRAYEWIRAELSRMGPRLEVQPTDPDQTEMEMHIQEMHIISLTTYLEDLLRSPTFEGLRKPEELAKLPPAERDAFENLWQQARRLLDKARKAKK
jgi:hypothetical protein